MENQERLGYLALYSMIKTRIFFPWKLNGIPREFRVSSIIFFFFHEKPFLEKYSPWRSVWYAYFLVLQLWLRLMDFIAIYILMLLFQNVFTISFSKGIPKLNCIQSERRALLKLKQDLKNSSNMLADWKTSNANCCTWSGVSCHNVTGHVTELRLGGSINKTDGRLSGKLNPALLDLKHLSYLDLSCNDFEKTEIPAWFWKMTSHLHYLNISGNRFQGKIPDLLITSQASIVLDFSSNNFTGPLPRISLDVTALDLSKNSMSGSISSFLCYGKKQLMKLEVLNLSDNRFSGEIPDCWEKWPKLVAIEFCNNNFSGEIPSSIGALTSLQSLHLRNNNLEGEVPSALRNCTELLTLDLGANHLSGELPPWMGERLPKLIIISLPTNRFHGPIPEEFCALSSLQILDLSHNKLSGNIPSCINNLTAMISSNKSDGKITYKTSRGCFFDNIALVMKGVVLDYSTILKLIKLVDLSDNNLSGEIPEEVTSLIGLLSLNLSKNHLVGRIPAKIGAMNLLECVDLSTNNLSGQIPNSMSQLSFLSYLNLSYNKLTGKIPSGTQLQSFSTYSFLGNKLYGPPLTNESKPAALPASNFAAENVDNRPKVDWFKLCVEFGFLSGFLCVAGPILLTNSWDLFIFRILMTLKLNFVASKM